MTGKGDRLRARCLTPAGAGGVAVLELCGPGALGVAAELAGLDREGPDAAEGRAARPLELRSGRLVLVRLVDGEEFLDEALLVVLDETRVELHVHGSPPLVARVLDVLAARGAMREERARHDVLRLEDEAWACLQHAPSEAAARMLLDQAQGALRDALGGLLAQAAECTSGSLEREVETLLQRGRVAQSLLRPPRVVLRGPVNAGKSTLFNALVGTERALVHAAEGTTRDAVRSRARLGEWVVELFDTAGDRAVSGGGGAAVEQAGQDLARRLAGDAELVLELVPARQALARPDLLRAGEPEVDQHKLDRPGGGLGPGDARTVCLQLVSRADELPAGEGQAGEGQAGAQGRRSGSPGSAGSPIPAELPAIRAREAPEQARALLARLVPEALGLPTRPWRPGAAVPFAEAHRVALAALVGGDAEPLAALLARGG